MTDDNLRALERRWRETRAAADEGAYLRERVRAGELPEVRLALAAQLGHAGAGAALVDSARPATLPPLLLELGRLDDRLLGEALLVLARAGLPLWERFVPDSRPRQALVAIEKWLDRPDRAHALAVESATEAVVGSADRCEGHLLRSYHDGAFNRQERTEIESAARAVQHAGATVAALTLRRRDSQATTTGVEQFTIAATQAGLDLDQALELLLEALAVKLLAPPG